jgi:hypothetical protein
LREFLEKKTQTIQLPEKTLFLLAKKARYKVLYGGRGGGKDWSFARAALMIAGSERKHFLVTREIQNSITESIHRLLREQIYLLGLDGLFDIQERSIVCPRTGSDFIFEGLYRNVDKIKSMEGVDICICCESQNITDNSWDILTPTIRKDNSEIWIEFNPQYEDDATYQRFVLHPPKNSIVREINWNDNPWFPDVLRLEMEEDKAFRPSIVENKWNGKPKGTGRKVYAPFNEKLHVKEIPFSVIKEKGNCFMSKDPAQHYYPACIWFALLPKNENNDTFYKYVYNEYPAFEDFGEYFHKMRRTVLFTGSLYDLAKRYYEKDGTAEHGLKIEKRFIDTRFATGTGSWSATTEGLVSLFVKPENGGILFDMPYVKSIDSAKADILTDLQYNTLQPVTPFNEPSLFVHPRCKNLIDSLANHRLEEVGDKEDERRKDYSDALKIGYAGLKDYKWKNPKGEENEFNFAVAGVPGGSWMGN